MMAGQEQSCHLALLVRSSPCTGRETRAEVDLALAALALDFSLEIYFFGDAVLQLAKDKTGAGALVPGGYKAWAALPELGDVTVYAESAWTARCERAGVEWLLPVEQLGPARMKNAWRQCDRVVVL